MTDGEITARRWRSEWNVLVTALIASNTVRTV